MERTQSTNANNFRKHKTKNKPKKCKMKRDNLYKLTTLMRVYRKPKIRIHTNKTLNKQTLELFKQYTQTNLSGKKLKKH